MKWINSVGKKDVETIKYALNYELDENEKKMMSLATNHEYLADWIVKPFQKFGYSDELKEVRKYSRLNSLQRNNYARMGALLNWDLKTLSFKTKFKYFFFNVFLRKDKDVFNSFVFYFLVSISLTSFFNADFLKTIVDTPSKIVVYSMFMALLSFIIASLAIFYSPLLVPYSKAIVSETYGGKEKQEHLKKTALKIIVSISGVNPVKEKIEDDKDFVSSVEYLSQKYLEDDTEKGLRLDEEDYMKFFEEVYLQSSKFSKEDYSYEELAQINKEHAILENQKFLNEKLANVPKSKSKTMKI